MSDPEAWPTAQIAVMGAQGAVNILYRKEIPEVVASGGAYPRSRWSSHELMVRPTLVRGPRGWRAFGQSS